MKNAIIFVLALFVSFDSAATVVKEEAKTKRVCIKKTDPNTKAEKEVCKTAKIRKKLEGTKVPEKK